MKWHQKVKKRGRALARMPHVSNLSLYVNTVCDRKREKEEVDHQSSPRQLRKEMIEREELRLENYGDKPPGTCEIPPDPDQCRARNRRNSPSLRSSEQPVAYQRWLQQGNRQPAGTITSEAESQLLVRIEVNMERIRMAIRPPHFMGFLKK